MGPRVGDVGCEANVWPPRDCDRITALTRQAACKDWELSMRATLSTSLPVPTPPCDLWLALLQSTAAQGQAWAGGGGGGARAGAWGPS
jgi:hypothetical protein